MVYDAISMQTKDVISFIGLNQAWLAGQNQNTVPAAFEF